MDLLGCADVDDGLVDISEFASIGAETLDEAITKWKFSKYKSPEAFTTGTSKDPDDVDSDDDLTESPKAKVIARARMAHNAARLASGITWPRESRTMVELTAAGLKLNESTNLYDLGQTSAAGTAPSDSPAAKKQRINSPGESPPDQAAATNFDHKITSKLPNATATSAPPLLNIH